MSSDTERKVAAALAASHLVKEGMVIGLGTGTTASCLVSILGERVRHGLNIKTIPTSEATRIQAEAEGIPVIGFGDHPHIDLTIDGADEIQRGTLNLIKGAGGALLREKIVASASTSLVIIATDSKVVDRLGSTCRLPVEIIPFGWEATFRQVSDRFSNARLRHNGAGAPYVTDCGNYIMDCEASGFDHPEMLNQDLLSIVGVVETGFFIGLAAEAFVAGADGVITLRPA